MSKTWQHRRPAAFRLGNDQVIVAPADEADGPIVAHRAGDAGIRVRNAGYLG